MKHTVDPQLLERPIRILVVGCGGNGSAIASGLPHLHQALLALGHPATRPAGSSFSGSPRTQPTEKRSIAFPPWPSYTQRFSREARKKMTSPPAAQPKR